MAKTAVERVRMTPEEKRRLAHLARREGRTKSDILRQGLLYVERVQSRRRNIHLLVEAARLTGTDEPKIRLRA